MPNNRNREGLLSFHSNEELMTSHLPVSTNARDRLSQRTLDKAQCSHKLLLCARSVVLPRTPTLGVSASRICAKLGVHETLAISRRTCRPFFTMCDIACPVNEEAQLFGGWGETNTNHCSGTICSRPNVTVCSKPSPARRTLQLSVQ